MKRALSGLNIKKKQAERYKIFIVSDAKAHTQLIVLLKVTFVFSKVFFSFDINNEPCMKSGRKMYEFMIAFIRMVSNLYFYIIV